MIDIYDVYVVLVIGSRVFVKAERIASWNRRIVDMYRKLSVGGEHNQKQAILNTYVLYLL